MKRAVTIQDISCVGKCSLTVALPIISAMGIETAVVPTAVLSNHTAFSDFTFHDLTGDLRPIAARFKEEGFAFDGIYTGYLGSREQIEIVMEFVDEFKGEGTKVIVDPAMADFGQMYKGFDASFAKEMKKLCDKADVVLPNLTEAAFMLGEEYVERPDAKEVERLLKALTDGGAKAAVLTGISFEEGRLGASSYSAGGGKVGYHAGTWYPKQFHGTGDVFASAFTGAFVGGKSLEESVALAVDYTAESVRCTLADPQARWYGVNFEEALPMLIGK